MEVEDKTNGINIEVETSLQTKSQLKFLFHIFCPPFQFHKLNN